MVNSIARDLTIELSDYTDQEFGYLIYGDEHPYFPVLGTNIHDVLDRVTINWGRQSLFQAPSNRTCDISFRPSQRQFDLPVENFLYARLDVRLGRTLLFSGPIDRLRREYRDGPDHRRGVIYHMSAVEGKIFAEDLTREMTVKPTSPHNLWSIFQSARNNPNQREIIGLGEYQGDRSPKYAVPDNPIRLSLFDAWSAAASPWPLSFPNWHPGFVKVGATTHRRDSVKTQTNVTSDSVIVAPVETSIENTPMAVEFSSGGTYGRPEDGEKWHRIAASRPSFFNSNNSFRSPMHIKYRMLESRQPFAIRTYAPIGGVYDRAWDLISHQKSDPLKLTFIEDDRFGTRKRSLFRTWEDPTDAIYLRPPYTDELDYYVKTRLMMIGGKLEITHERTKHEVSAIYV